MGDATTRPGEGTATETVRETKPPQMFRVLLHNDDYTTMDFVVAILVGVFRKPTDEAVRIMLNVHHEGIGVCGMYPAQVAETKIATVHNQARDNGFPLRCSMEPE